MKLIYLLSLIPVALLLLVGHIVLPFCDEYDYNIELKERCYQDTAAIPIAGLVISISMLVVIHYFESRKLQS